MNHWLRSLRSLGSFQSLRSLRVALRVATTALLFAAGSPLALAAADDPDALHWKAEDLMRYTDDVNGLEALIRQGMNVKRASANSQGRTLLFTAATEAKIPMIDALLAAGADPNARDESGMTALRHVAWTGKDQVTVTKRLLAAKADPNLGDEKSTTPLMKAAQGDFPELVRLLLEHCARRDLADSFFHLTAMKFAKSDAVRQALQTAPPPGCRP